MSNKINLSLFHSRKFGFWKVNQLLKVIFKLIIFYIFACDFTMEYVVGWFCVDGGDELGCRLRVLVSREWNTIYLNCKGNSNWFRLFFFPPAFELNYLFYKNVGIFLLSVLNRIHLWYGVFSQKRFSVWIHINVLFFFLLLQCCDLAAIARI